MSEHLDKYRRRLSRNGENIGEVYANNTIAYIEATFHASPTFRVMGVNSTEFPDIKEIDARVVEVERLGTLREVLFRPKQGLNLGTYVKFDNETWIVSDVWGSSLFQQKVMVQKCNRELRWRSKDNKIYSIDCIASQSPIGSKANQGEFEIEFNKYDVRLPTGQLFVYVEKNSKTSTIELNHRFIFGNSVYEVYGIDDTSLINKDGYGIIQLTIRVTTKQDKDDFENLVAFNEYETVVETVEENTVGNDNGGNGGLIW